MNPEEGNFFGVPFYKTRHPELVEDFLALYKLQINLGRTIMLFNESWGWIRLRQTKQKLRLTVENLIEKYSDPPSATEIQTTWTHLKQCIPRGDSFAVYFERQYGAKKQKVNLTLNPRQAEDMGSFSIIEPGLNRTGKIVDLREQEFPGFVRYFEFDTVGIAKSSGENLSWQMGIVKLPEISADQTDNAL
jgi:hypothetical protein